MTRTQIIAALIAGTVGPFLFALFINALRSCGSSR